MAFGQSNIVLSDVNPELTVGINSDNKVFDYYTGNGNLPYSTVYATVVGPYALTKVNIGGGVLANVQGNVTINQVELEVDDRNGTVPNIVTLTPSNGITWTSTSGAHPILTVTNLRN